MTAESYVNSCKNSVCVSVSWNDRLFQRKLTSRELFCIKKVTKEHLKC